MRRNSYLGASGKNLTLPFAPETFIFYNIGITLLSVYIFSGDLAICLVRMRRNSVNSASGLKSAVTIDFL